MLPTTGITADLPRLAQMPDAEFPAYAAASEEQALAQLSQHWRAGNHVDAVYYAMHLPETYDAGIARWVLSKLPMIPSPYYFLLSQKTFAAAPDDAVFWHLVAGINGFYDAARCMDRVQGQQVQYLASINRPAAVWKEILRERRQLMPVLQQAVQWLESNPNLPEPAYLCSVQDDSGKARTLRDGAVEQLKHMVLQKAVPSASPRLRQLVREVLEVRQELLLTRLQLEQEEDQRVRHWAAGLSDELLSEYIALAYLRYWNEPVGEAALDFYLTAVGQKTVRNEVSLSLGMPTDVVPLTAGEAAERERLMQRDALRRMRSLQDSVDAYRYDLMRMAAGDPRSL